MKSVFWLLPLLAICLWAGCKKDNVKKNDPPNMLGSWELRIKTGNYSAQFYEAGNGRIVEFKNNTVTYFEDKKTTYSAPYYLSQYNGKCQYAKDSWLVHYGDSDLDGKLVNLPKDTLTIGSLPCVYDGGVGIYVKIK